MGNRYNFFFLFRPEFWKKNVHFQFVRWTTFFNYLYWYRKIPVIQRSYVVPFNENFGVFSFECRIIHYSIQLGVRPSFHPDLNPIEHVWEMTSDWKSTNILFNSWHVRSICVHPMKCLNLTAAQKLWTHIDCELIAAFPNSKSIKI